MTSRQIQPEVPQPQQRQRSRQIKPIRLQERDLDMFVSLSIARYLSVYAIEWLHFNGWRGTGGWRERYKAFLEKRKSDSSAVYYPAPNIYHRLTALRASPDPLVHRVARSVERASVVYNRLPDAYTLTGSGASLLCSRRGYELDDLWYEDPRRRSIKNFEHSVSIGTFYGVRVAMEQRIHLIDFVWASFAFALHSVFMTLIAQNMRRTHTEPRMPRAGEVSFSASPSRIYIYTLSFNRTSWSIATERPTGAAFYNREAEQKLQQLTSNPLRPQSYRV